MTATLGDAVRAALLTPEPLAKVRATRRLVREWRAGRLAASYGPVPPRPTRPVRPELLPPNRMPRRGGGSAAGRIALLHALAHIEYVATDLALDLVGRFGAGFPRAFTDDWLGVAADEAMHFALLDRRLRALGSGYGALPAHDGLWEAAAATAHDPLARLAVVPMVLEARGLDVTPATIDRFAVAGDAATVRILRRILADELRHVGLGVDWFRHAAAQAGESVPGAWGRLVAEHFGGRVKPPFNASARAEAGLTPEWMELVAPGYASG